MKTKIKALMLGGIVVFVVLEIALRVTGVVESRLEGKIGINIQGARGVILCIGNSFTRGYGANREGSYPAHLQILLDEQYGNNVFQVVNLGRSGWNTHQILTHITAFIEQTNPVLIILRGGGPNEFNLNGAPFISFSRGYLWYLVSEKIRLVKYLRQLLHDYHVRKKLTDVVDIEQEHEFKQRAHFIEVNKWFDQCYDNQTWVACSEGRKDLKTTQNAILTYQKLLKHMPDDFLYYIKLSVLYLQFKNDIDNAVNILHKGLYHILKIENRVTRQYWQQFYFYHLIRIKSFVSQNSELYDKIQRSISLLALAVPFHEGVLKMQDKKKTAGWIRSDLDEITSIIKKRNIGMVIHNYPPLPPGVTFHRREINTILSVYAKKHDIPFVNLEKVMMSKHADGEDISKYYYQFNDKLDFHLNSKGYKLNAFELFKKISGDNLL